MSNGHGRLTHKQRLMCGARHPRVRNKARLKPMELVDPRNQALRTSLQKAEFALMAGADVVVEDDDGPTGSGSDSE